MTTISEVNNMANNLEFVMKSNQKNNDSQSAQAIAAETNDPEVKAMANDLDLVIKSAQNAPAGQNNPLNTPSPLPNVLETTDNNETVFDIQMKAAEGNMPDKPNPTGMGDIIDIMG